jgi:hypothetical protein
MKELQASGRLAKLMYNSFIKTTRKITLGIEPKNRDRLVMEPS